MGKEQAKPTIEEKDQHNKILTLSDMYKIGFWKILTMSPFQLATHNFGRELAATEAKEKEASRSPSPSRSDDKKY